MLCWDTGTAAKSQCHHWSGMWEQQQCCCHWNGASASGLFQPSSLSRSTSPWCACCKILRGPHSWTTQLMKQSTLQVRNAPILSLHWLKANPSGFVGSFWLYCTRCLRESQIQSVTNAIATAVLSHWQLFWQCVRVQCPQEVGNLTGDTFAILTDSAYLLPSCLLTFP